MSAKDDYNKAIDLAKVGKHKEALKLLEPHKANPVVRDAYSKISMQIQSSTSDYWNPWFARGVMVVVLIVGVIVGYAIGQTFAVRQAYADAWRESFDYSMYCSFDQDYSSDECQDLMANMLYNHRADTIACSRFIENDLSIANGERFMNCIENITD